MATYNSITKVTRVVVCSVLIFVCIHRRTQCQGVPDRPNIVLIYMDDMGYADVSSYGAVDYLTPNIDRLANEGMRFTEFYAAHPICTASRASLLTGTYSNRFGLYGAIMPHSGKGLPQEEMTIAEMLKPLGYATACIGKWHLGDERKFLPLQHGFDYFFGLPYSNDMWPLDYHGREVKPGDPMWERKHTKPPLPLIEGNEPIRIIGSMNDQNMLTTWYTEKAVDFINEHSKTPFFLYLAHSMVHTPLGVSDRYRGKSKRGEFGDVMMEVDWSVGEVMSTLKKNHLDKNTLVIFTADNGPWMVFGDHAGSTGALREGKSTTFEGGQREPAIFRWPTVVPKGVICNSLSANLDIMPTIAAITGGKLPKHKIDGVNILRLLKGDVGVEPREHLFYYHDSNSLEAVRKGSWKLVLPHKYQSVEGEIPGRDGYPGRSHEAFTELSLYDLSRDPGERYNVVDQYPEIVGNIMKLVREARKDLGDDLTGAMGEGRRVPEYNNK